MGPTYDFLPRIKYHTMANMTIPLKVTELKFMDCAVTSTDDGQKEKNHMTRMYPQANTLFAMPNAPGIFQGPHCKVSGPINAVVGSYCLIPWIRLQRSKEQMMK